MAALLKTIYDFAMSDVVLETDDFSTLIRKLICTAYGIASMFFVAVPYYAYRAAVAEDKDRGALIALTVTVFIFSLVMCLPTFIYMRWSQTAPDWLMIYCLFVATIITISWDIITTFFPVRATNIAIALMTIASQIPYGLLNVALLCVYYIIVEVRDAFTIDIRVPNAYEGSGPEKILFSFPGILAMTLMPALMAGMVVEYIRLITGAKQSIDLAQAVAKRLLRYDTDGVRAILDAAESEEVEEQKVIEVDNESDLIKHAEEGDSVLRSYNDDFGDGALDEEESIDFFGHDTATDRGSVSSAKRSKSGSFSSPNSSSPGNSPTKANKLLGSSHENSAVVSINSSQQKFIIKKTVKKKSEISQELVKIFRKMADNLDLYRPHLPNYVLPAETSESELSSARGDGEGFYDDDLDEDLNDDDWMKSSGSDVVGAGGSGSGRRKSGSRKTSTTGGGPHIQHTSSAIRGSNSSFGDGGSLPGVLSPSNAAFTIGKRGKRSLTGAHSQHHSQHPGGGGSTFLTGHIVERVIFCKLNFGKIALKFIPTRHSAGFGGAGAAQASMHMLQQQQTGSGSANLLMDIPTAASISGSPAGSPDMIGGGSGSGSPNNNESSPTGVAVDAGKTQSFSVTSPDQSGVAAETSGAGISLAELSRKKSDVANSNKQQPQHTKSGIRSHVQKELEAKATKRINRVIENILELAASHDATVHSMVGDTMFVSWNAAQKGFFNEIKCSKFLVALRPAVRRALHLRRGSSFKHHHHLTEKETTETTNKLERHASSNSIDDAGGPPRRFSKTPSALSLKPAKKKSTSSPTTSSSPIQSNNAEAAAAATSAQDEKTKQKEKYEHDQEEFLANNYGGAYPDLGMGDDVMNHAFDSKIPDENSPNYSSDQERRDSGDLDDSELDDFTNSLSAAAIVGAAWCQVGGGLKRQMFMLSNFSHQNILNEAALLAERNDLMTVCRHIQSSAEHEFSIRGCGVVSIHYGLTTKEALLTNLASLTGLPISELCTNSFRSMTISTKGMSFSMPVSPTSRGLPSFHGSQSSQGGGEFHSQGNLSATGSQKPFTSFSGSEQQLGQIAGVPAFHTPNASGSGGYVSIPDSSSQDHQQLDAGIFRRNSNSPLNSRQGSGFLGGNKQSPDGSRSASETLGDGVRKKSVTIASPHSSHDSPHSPDHLDATITGAAGGGGGGSSTMLGKQPNTITETAVFNHSGSTQKLGVEKNSTDHPPFVDDHSGVFPSVQNSQQLSGTLEAQHTDTYNSPAASAATLGHQSNNNSTNPQIHLLDSSSSSSKPKLIDNPSNSNSNSRSNSVSQSAGNSVTNIVTPNVMSTSTSSQPQPLLLQAQQQQQEQGLTSPLNDISGIPRTVSSMGGPNLFTISGVTPPLMTSQPSFTASSSGQASSANFGSIVINPQEEEESSVQQISLDIPVALKNQSQGAGFVSVAVPIYELVAKKRLGGGGVDDEWMYVVGDGKEVHEHDDTAAANDAASGDGGSNSPNSPTTASKKKKEDGSGPEAALLSEAAVALAKCNLEKTRVALAKIQKVYSYATELKAFHELAHLYKTVTYHLRRCTHMEEEKRQMVQQAVNQQPPSGHGSAALG